MASKPPGVEQKPHDCDNRVTVLVTVELSTTAFRARRCFEMCAIILLL